MTRGRSPASAPARRIFEWASREVLARLTVTPPSSGPSPPQFFVGIRLLVVSPLQRRRAPMAKANSTTLGDVFAGAAVIAIAMLTIAFFYRLAAP